MPGKKGRSGRKRGEIDRLGGALSPVDIEGMEVAVSPAIAAWITRCRSPSVMVEGMSSPRQIGGFAPGSRLALAFYQCVSFPQQSPRADHAMPILSM